MRTLFSLLMLLILSAVTFAQDTRPSPPAIYTHGSVDGNRLMPGSANFLEEVETVGLALQGRPFWVIGAESSVGYVWWVVLADGRVQKVHLSNDFEIQSSDVVASLPVGMPPVIRFDDAGEPELFTDLPDDISSFSPPVLLEEGLLYIADNGDLVMQDASGQPISRIELNALPDARIVMNAAGLAALYTDATAERYVHGIMGDDLEAASLTLIDTQQMQFAGRIDLAGEQVFEGIMPFWADLNGDELDDLVTTVSDSAGGAQLRVYGVDGGLIATSEPIGLSNRWRHQLAWGAFGSAGEMRLVEVLTPHIGGITGFFALEDESLVRQARFEGFTSHVIGSRNLDMVAAGDFDGDGQPEIVLPDQGRGRIAGIALTTDTQAELRWWLPLDGTLESNLSVISDASSNLILAAGVAHSQGENQLQIMR